MRLRVIKKGTWPNSAEEQMDYWLSRTPEERLRAGRAFFGKVYWWMHGKPLPGKMENIVRRARRPS